jgi:hypothetical protein
MPPTIEKIWVYRMIHYRNLDYILQHGIYYRRSIHFDPNYVNVGSAAIIDHRDTVHVKCYPDTMLNDYIPFYFGVRTPMLYKIKTGHGVAQLPQHEIIYLACRFQEITGSDLQWCFTDGNAARYISEFHDSVDDIAKLDWKSINAEEWTDNNQDGDHDRMRKKHSEFLVKDHVPIEYVKSIVVLTDARKAYVEELIVHYGLPITVYLDTKHKFYYR